MFCVFEENDLKSDSDSETQFSDSEEHSDDEEQAYIEQSYEVHSVHRTKQVEMASIYKVACNGCDDFQWKEGGQLLIFRKT